MPRTEFHLKLAQEIQAIESIARANERVAFVLEEQQALTPDLVITLIKEIIRVNTGTVNCKTIKLDFLTDPAAREAYRVLGFRTDNNDAKLKELCRLIPHTPIAQEISQQVVNTSPKSEPSSSPTATPPPGKAPAKKE